MSADFWSFVAPITYDKGFEILQRLRSREVLNDIVGPNEETIHRFNRDGEFADPGKVAISYSKPPEPPLDVGAAYVDATFEDIEELDSECASSPNYPSIVALDRVVALPNGIDLMCGRAIRLLDHKQVLALEKAYVQLLEKFGESKIIAQVALYLDRGANGEEDAEEILSVLENGVSSAVEQGKSLLILGCIVP
jgi:hypothetical protein